MKYNNQGQMSLFSGAEEKGRGEWDSFSVVGEDRAGMFRVATPRKHETPRYPNILHISREPRRITPRFAH